MPDKPLCRHIQGADTRLFHPQQQFSPSVIFSCGFLIKSLVLKAAFCLCTSGAGKLSPEPVDSSVGKMGKDGVQPENTGAGENCRFFEQVIFPPQNSDLSGFPGRCAVAASRSKVSCGYIQVFCWRCAYRPDVDGKSKVFPVFVASFPQVDTCGSRFCPQKLWGVLWIRWAKVARSP